MYEEVDEREDIAQYQVTPVDTKWVDTDRACEEVPRKLDPDLSQEISKVTIGQISTQGHLHWRR